jgi:Mn2+/Fe2+ NRAMP family transporter
MKTTRVGGGLRSIGPALIVASVVLGPGSILAASRVGADFGYALAWVVVFAALLMLVMTALAARVGTEHDATPCELVARRAGRPAALLVGLVLFGVVACFQFSNNIGVLAALEPLSGGRRGVEVGVLVLLNLAAGAALVGRTGLYRPLEVLMKALVGLMALGFLGNLLLARPSPAGVLAGLVPALPEGVDARLLPRRAGAQVVDPLLPVVALVGTTFSVAAAFYQAYLVRAKGWGRADLRRGLVDASVGIGVLGLLTLTILVTAAAVLHGVVSGAELESAADVSRQLEPLFGTRARLLFGLGLFAGAFSSFLVNALVGGTVLADALGRGGDVDGPWTRALTGVALAAGLVVALAMRGRGWSPVHLVTFAQALTVLGNPVLAGVLLWLAWSSARRTPLWMLMGATLGLVVVTLLALRTAVRLWIT